MEGFSSDLTSVQVAEFFSIHGPPTKQDSPTQQECNQHAQQVTGGSLRLAPIQGRNSYTVIADTGDGEYQSIVQFRIGESPLDLIVLGYAEQTYGTFVPTHAGAGQLGNFHVYRMTYLGGVPLYYARRQLVQGDLSGLENTVHDFARSVDISPPASPFSLTLKEPRS